MFEHFQNVDEKMNKCKTTVIKEPFSQISLLSKVLILVWDVDNYKVNSVNLSGMQWSSQPTVNILFFQYLIKLNWISNNINKKQTPTNSTITCIYSINHFNYLQKNDGFTIMAAINNFFFQNTFHTLLIHFISSFESFLQFAKSISNQS